MVILVVLPVDIWLVSYGLSGGTTSRYTSYLSVER
jgi:hypothetical protein